jgi:hypothetical protein
VKGILNLLDFLHNICIKVNGWVGGRRMLKEINELEDLINHLKKELIQTAESTGLNSHQTICCSQKLDEHITIYQKLFYKKQKMETAVK